MFGREKKPGKYHLLLLKTARNSVEKTTICVVLNEKNTT
jgi:hypothetical protein